MTTTAALRTSSPELSAFLAAHPGRDWKRDGIRQHYLDEGHGPPVVMVHGNPTWSFYYRRLVEALSPTHRAIVPDHIGCGLSDKPDDSRYRYTLESRVDDLERLLDHLGVRERVSLVVHDWGGMIGTAYAARHPERIAKMVVMNTAGFHMPAAKSFPWALHVCRDTPLGAWTVRGLNAFARGTAWIGCKNERMPRSLRDAYAAPYDDWSNRIAIHRFVQDIPLRPGDRAYDLVSWVQDRLPLLAEVPMLLAWGMKDFVFDEPFLKEWERRFPAAEVHRYPNAGHYVLEDEAASLVPRIRDFLAGTGTRPTGGRADGSEG
ncbi:alpha/beta fold hydrolase [Paludisphaera mucosa]|uniref:Alpha/beta fold hydrolase n=1 Tax=Paludisphaera mucosa TaxID=3030827 RepID=A0ABT6FFG5_9BACT|nr:alpha/beta fold hydrolase [Paludisphaera mucosa]MDG3006244.1 alpha/beta fold hydrolase [Paludisphaera mucosa]